MIDHISVRTSDLKRAVRFYTRALAPLGYEQLMEFEGFVGLGVNHKPDLWLTATDKPINPTHVAFATDRESVAKFHKAAVAAGGKDNGKPGPRPKYHAHYFGAFVLDPDGNNLEACCHAPVAATGKKPAATKKPAAKKAASSKQPAATSKASKKKPAPSKKPAKKAPARR